MSTSVVSTLPLLRVVNGATDSGASSRESRSNTTSVSVSPALERISLPAFVHTSSARASASIEEFSNVHDAASDRPEKKESKSAPLSERKFTRFPRLLPLTAPSRSVSLSPAQSSSSLSSSSSASTTQSSPMVAARPVLQKKVVAKKVNKIDPDIIAEQFCQLLLAGGSNYKECRKLLSALNCKYKKPIAVGPNRIALYTVIELAIAAEWKDAVIYLVQRGASLITETLGDVPVWHALQTILPERNAPLFSSQEVEKLLLDIVPLNGAEGFQFLQHLYQNGSVYKEYIPQALYLVQNTVTAEQRPSWYKETVQFSEILYWTIVYGTESLCLSMMQLGKVDSTSERLMDAAITNRRFKVALALIEAKSCSKT